MTPALPLGIFCAALVVLTALYNWVMHRDCEGWCFFGRVQGRRLALSFAWSLLFLAPAYALELIYQ